VGTVWDLVAYHIEQVSTLTFSEYAILLATLESKLKPKEFNCNICITQYGKSQRTMSKSDKKRKSKGCFDFISKAYRIENIRYNSCIGNYVYPMDFLIEAFSLYEKGVLPFKGSIGEQPNKIMEVFSIIESRRQTHLEKENKSKGS